METPETRTFGEFLRRLRVAAGMTQAALAEGAGLSARGISDLERGLRRAPHAATIELLARALRVEPVELAQVARQSRRITALPTAASEMAEAPPRPRHNLPSELSSFVGRRDELDELTALLHTTRLLTLAGPGGIGKTRLAVRVARASLEHFVDGVWQVELASLASGDIVADRVAEVLAPGESTDSPIERLTVTLRDKELLLVLDNCEHVLAACADLVSAVLRACDGVRVLATSREPLGLTGEVIWRVPPLSLPVPRPTLQPAALERSDAAQLFLERVAAVQPRFAVALHNVSAIAETCRQLDGIPLALELAAAHVPALGVGGVVRRLDDRFRLLVGRDRSAPSRHQTLRATIDWSYALLDEVERALLDRLAVFAGGCSLEAVEAVCTRAPLLDSGAVLDVLERLITKSLVIAEPGLPGVRYRLLETVRTYATERVAESGETDTLRSEHARYFMQLAEIAEPELNGSDQVRWLDELEQEHDNLRAALAWGLERDVELGLRVASALARFWFVRGHLSEGAAWLDRLLELADDDTSALARANALTAAGILAWHRADSVRAEQHHRASLALRDDGPGDPRLSRTLYELAKVLSQKGDVAAAREFGERALDRWRKDEDPWGEAVALNFLAELLREERQLDEAAAKYAESRRLFELSGDQRGVAIATQNLGIVAIELGDYARARELHQATLPLKRELGDREGLAASLVDVAYLALLAGDPRLAARLCGAAERNRESVGAVLPTFERATLERTLGLTRAALGDAFLMEWLEGQRLSLDGAIEEALAFAG